MQLINGDCLQVMQKMPDKSIDLIITDPPYGKSADKGTNGFGIATNRRYKSKWDSKRPAKEYFDEMQRISKNMILFGANYFCDFLPPSNCWIFWDKKGNIKFQNPFADGELIYTTFTKPIKKYTFVQQGFITESKDKRYHPTQKPVELLTTIISQFSKPSDVILDCFMGSGSTGVACLKTNHDFIGIELDEQYFKIAKDRLNTEVRL